MFKNTIQLNQHNYDYYVLDTSIISDFEFFELKELQELENKYPEYFDESLPTQRVGVND
jgi:DNA ligase (NAD+)